MYICIEMERKYSILSAGSGRKRGKMKIKCDVCEKEEASVFCSADEAALCEACDRRVHYANKLATKHQRFSLLHPSSKDSPRCDVCQDRRALLFCKEDRALLCRECDVPIHKANLHTQNHNRFLLTGIKISAAAPSSSAYDVDDNRPAGTRNKNEIRNNSSRSNETVTTPNTHYSTLNAPESTSNTCSVVDSRHCVIQQEGSVSTSSISEYLMETLPGWHVEDFLDPPTCSPYGFCKTRDSSSPSSSTVDAESISGNFSVQDFGEKDMFFQNDLINGSEGIVELKEFVKVSRKQKREYIRAPWISTAFF